MYIVASEVLKYGAFIVLFYYFEAWILIHLILWQSGQHIYQNVSIYVKKIGHRFETICGKWVNVEL